MKIAMSNSHTAHVETPCGFMVVILTDDKNILINHKSSEKCCTPFIGALQFSLNRIIKQDKDNFVNTVDCIIKDFKNRRCYKMAEHLTDGMSSCIDGLAEALKELKKNTK